MATFILEPATATLAPGQTVRLRVADPAIAAESLAWSLEGDAGGTIDADGTYTAPAGVTASVDVRVIARAGADSGSATVTIRPESAAVAERLEVLPGSAQVAAGGTHQFAAKRAGGADATVTWSLAGVGHLATGLGAIDAGGLYTAPPAFTSVEVITVTAHDTQDPALAATASITPILSSAGPGETPLPAGTSGDISVTPPSAVLAAKATQLFEARDANGQAVAVTWSLLGTGGLSKEIVGAIDPASGVYSAPAEIIADRTVIVLAADAGGRTDKAFVVLTPGAVRVVPAEVTLRAKEQQRFTALVQGDPSNEVEWLTSPEAGELPPTPLGAATTVFTAPAAMREDARIVITAISKKTQLVGHATVTLLADEWVGWGPRLIGIWLLVLAFVVYFLYGIWPPPGDRAKLAAAEAAAVDAANIVAERKETVDKQTAALSELQSALKVATSGATADAARAENLRGRLETLQPTLADAMESHGDAERDRTTKQATAAAERKLQAENREDELKLFVLVLLAGALGSFVHTTRSFVDFRGNRRLRPSWSWWYVLQPFTGASLAMVVYLVIRGGLFAAASGTAALNPWGLVAVAALVGLFSKQATNKLDELFSTMFRTDKDRELRDKLNGAK
jgi:hypothetical protein